jgi:DNA-binding NarL/FixJ family response regulator
VRTVIAEDNPLLRDGIAALLTDHDIAVVATAADADELQDAVAAHRPDIAIVDVRMPPTYTDEGVRAAAAIRAAHPETAVLLFSQWVETTYARRLLRDSAGSIGYLLKDRIVSTQEFLDALHRVAAGGTALDPEVIRQMLTVPRRDPGLDRLTRREHEILALVAEGRSNPAIADRLHLAGRSVEKHVTSIFTKLNLAPTSTDHRRVLAVLRYLDARRD